MFDPKGAFNEAPLGAPTVFNFFFPDYRSPGAAAAAGLVTPEMEVVDSTYALLVPNNLVNYLWRPAPSVTNPPSTVAFFRFRLLAVPSIRQDSHCARRSDEPGLLWRRDDDDPQSNPDRAPSVKRQHQRH